MTFMTFNSNHGVHAATNCLVDLTILETLNTFVVSTEKTQDEFQTWTDAVKFAEWKFGVKFNLK